MLIKKPFKKGMGPSTAPYYKAAAASAYQGPGDIVSGAIAWASPARAYSAAFAALAGPIMDIVDSANANPATINILTSGFVDLTTLNAWIVAHGTASVKKLYDQSGTGNHFAQAVVANMPTIAQSALNGLPGLQAGSPFIIPTPALTLSQPMSISTVYIRTSGTAIGAALGATSGGIIAGSDNVANKARIGFGTNIAGIPATDNAWHSVQGVGNGVSGAYNFDGTDTAAQNLGTTALAGNTFRLCSDGANSLTGKVMEGGLWPSAFDATQRGNLSTNQHSATNGYNF